MFVKDFCISSKFFFFFPWFFAVLLLCVMWIRMFELSSLLLECYFGLSFVLNGVTIGPKIGMSDKEKFFSSCTTSIYNLNIFPLIFLMKKLCKIELLLVG